MISAAASAARRAQPSHWTWPGPSAPARRVRSARASRSTTGSACRPRRRRRRLPALRVRSARPIAQASRRSMALLRHGSPGAVQSEQSPDAGQCGGSTNAPTAAAALDAPWPGQICSATQMCARQSPAVWLCAPRPGTGAAPPPPPPPPGMAACPSPGAAGSGLTPIGSGDRSVINGAACELQIPTAVLGSEAIQGRARVWP